MDQKNSMIPVACFAPPLTDELLAEYETLIEGMPDELAETRDAMRDCLACVKAWWELPESTLPGERWRIRNTVTKKDQEYRVVPLEDEHISALYDVTPWMRELAAMEPLFDALPLSPPALRDAAHHLLWHAKEVSLDREPLTADKLGV